jgi:hypothetical protein
MSNYIRLKEAIETVSRGKFMDHMTTKVHRGGREFDVKVEQTSDQQANVYITTNGEGILSADGTPPWFFGIANLNKSDFVITEIYKHLDAHNNIVDKSLGLKSVKTSASKAPVAPQLGEE